MKLLFLLIRLSLQTIQHPVLSMVLAGLAVVAGGFVRQLTATGNAIFALVQTWEDKRLPATNLWWVREVLARQYWLGPFRPKHPLDPLAACGLVPGEASSFSWWRLLLQPRESRRLLACLDELLPEAEQEHDAFAARLCWGLGLGMVLALLGLVVAHRLLQCLTQGPRWQPKSQGPKSLDAAPLAITDSREGAIEQVVGQGTTPAPQMLEFTLDTIAAPQDGMKESTTVDVIDTCQKEDKKSTVGTVVTRPKRHRRKRKVVNAKNKDVVPAQKETKVKVTTTQKEAKVKATPVQKVKVTSIPAQMQTEVKPLPSQKKAVVRPVPALKKGKVKTMNQSLTWVALNVPTECRVCTLKFQQQLQLKEKYPGVNISVPRASDPDRCPVVINGPLAEVRAVKTMLAAHLGILQQKRQQHKKQKRRTGPPKPQKVTLASYMQVATIGNADNQGQKKARRRSKRQQNSDGKCCS